MTVYIVIKDIISFLKTEKRIFLWLVFSMTVCSFVLNYTYAFARYRGSFYDENMGENIPVYKIYSNGDASFTAFSGIFADMEQAGFPAVEETDCMTNTKEGFRIAGATKLSPKNFKLTGAWQEGYWSVDYHEGMDICAVNSKLLTYGKRLKMTGEPFDIDGESFCIRGVYESFQGAADIVILSEKYKEKYDRFNEIWITFGQPLDTQQEEMLGNLVKTYIAHGSMECPAKYSETGEAITKSNQMQYSMFIVMLVVFLASVLQYWYDVNIAAYTVYWITGATWKTILKVVFGETFMLCGVTYIAGLLLNMAARTVFTKNMPLTYGDIGMGFVIFWGTMLIFSLLNMVRICRSFSVQNIRRE